MVLDNLPVHLLLGISVILGREVSEKRGENESTVDWNQVDLLTWSLLQSSPSFDILRH